MLKKCIIILLIVFSFNTLYSYANDTSIIKSYNNFIIKLESKYRLEDQLIVLEKIKVKIDNILKSKNISTKSIILIKELNNINNRKIADIKNQINITNTEDNYQKDLERKEVEKFKEYKIPSIPDYVLEIIDSNNRVYLNIIYDEKNTNFEYLYNGKIYRLIFNSYYKINHNNSNQLKNKKGYVFFYNGNYIFVDSYEIEEKIPYSKSYKHFKGTIDNSNYYLKNGIYYYYKFDKFIFINEKYGFYKKSLLSLGLDPKDLILYKNGESYSFIKNYTEEKLINYEIIKYINDKSKFLSYVYDDKKNLSYDTNKYFTELKKISEDLTQGLSKEDKIKVIYNYVLENINYTNPIDLSKKEIFSGIHTYKNRDGVCEGYVKLMAYMLMFSGVDDIEVIRGFVINAPDFPKVGHAWLKIGSYYYDPTFDDPIGNTQTKQYNEYVYYKLPGDLFYTNRYDLINLPEELKSKSKNELAEIVNKNLYNLVSKYKNNGYNILKYSLFLYDNGLNYSDKISIKLLENIIVKYDVNGLDMSFTLDGKKTYIKKLKYYKIDDANTEEILRTLNYNYTDKYIIKWDFGDGTYEYRLAYELEVY
ncbi:hypothetical protein EOM39_01550 [Candidatus Gracilibacteria bacterium]|nr:hypothetical protein [Candidatus Gracilibacteria bacterium]